jgi:hypothetical protein
VLFLFGKKIIEETIQNFKEEDGLELSEQQAIEYLNSLVDLFLSFSSRGPDHHPWGRRGPRRGAKESA